MAPILGPDPQVHTTNQEDAERAAMRHLCAALPARGTARRFLRHVLPGGSELRRLPRALAAGEHEPPHPLQLAECALGGQCR